MHNFALTKHKTNVCIVTVCFLQSSEDLSLQTQFSLTILLCPRSDTCHYRHINRSYLLTYHQTEQVSMFRTFKAKQKR